jgi:hypothetical protein
VNEPLPEKVVVPDEPQVTVSTLYGQRPDEPWAHVPDSEMSAEMEQDVRDFYGYAPSETRTRAGRKRAAVEIVVKNEDLIEWAREVWARQGELMREANEPAWKLKQRAEMKKKGSSWD